MHPAALKISNILAFVSAKQLSIGLVGQLLQELMHMVAMRNSTISYGGFCPLAVFPQDAEEKL